jgi:hypothetical protein
MPARTRARAVACLLVSIFVVAGCGFGFGRPGYGDSVNGIACDKGGNVSFRATVHLWLIKRDGQREGPTGGIGSTGSACSYWVQTQDDEGVIHILAPYPVTPKLITFFMIWDYAIPAGSGNSGPFRDASEHGRIVVDGTLVEGGPARVFLVDGQTIELFEPDTDPPSLLPGI